MKLTISGRQIALPTDAKISIQRSSPALNEDTGSFSYPFPVPTAPNQQILGWPGKLQRAREMADQTFILEDSGLQVFSGEVDYDLITKNEIGVILKSGYTVFRSKMSGRKLGEIDYGSESWLPLYYTTQQVTAKLAEWDAANTNGNAKYYVSPIAINDALYTTSVDDYVNKIDKLTGKLKYDSGGTRQNVNLYMLQFRASFMIDKIFESAGYTVLSNELKTSEFGQLVVFSRIINVTYGSTRFGIPGLEQTDILHYSKLMPDVTVLEFIDNIAGLLCLMYDIDERKKTVRILFKKNIFEPGNVEDLKMVELAGWQHSEERNSGGFKIGYKSQDSDLDTKTDYIPDRDVISLPVPTIDGEIVHVVSQNIDYITVTTNEIKEWKQIGRLKEYISGNGAEDVELDLKVPRTVAHPDGYPLPKFEIIPLNRSYAFPAIQETIVSLYHGRKEVNSVGIPYLSGDCWGFADGWSIGLTPHLAPPYIYEKVYKDFLNWKAFKARGFTKFIELTLPQVLALRWDKKYNIDGIELILDKINFELPHYGTVKIEGFTG